MYGSESIVILGMSCVGKTTFAKRIADYGEHQYRCFDALYNWHEIETFGFSIKHAMQHVVRQCHNEKFVLDGWHLACTQGCLLPKNASTYVLYSGYSRIISQYRIPVVSFYQHWHMFQKWYLEVDYTQFPRVEYWENTGQFEKRSEAEFLSFCASQSRSPQTEDQAGMKGSSPSPCEF